MLTIENAQDMRDAIQKMADANRVSVSTLNLMAGAAAGILRRYLRGKDRRRIDGVLVDELVETDIKFSVVLKTVEAAGYELVLQPKPTAPRRERVLNARRQARSAESDPGVAPQ